MASDTVPIDVAVDQVSRDLINDTPSAALDADIRWALHAAQLQFVDYVNPTSFHVDATITTSTGDSSYELAEDFDQIIASTVKFTATPFRTLTEMTMQLFNERWLSATESTGDPEHYYITHRDKSDGQWRMFLWPTPDTSTRVIQYSYRSLPDPIWNTSRGGGHVFDRRLSHKAIPHILEGAKATGKFSKYLGSELQRSIEDKWEKWLDQSRRTAHPVVGEVLQRRPYPMMRHGRQAWTGDPLSGRVE